MGKQTLKRPVLISLCLIVLIAAVSGYALHRSRRSMFGVLDEADLIRIPRGQLEDGMLYITQARRAYQRGKMTLVIPAIGVFTPIGESTAPQGLEEMPGLYEFSQLPGEGDNNVSIAGHRDIHDMVFLQLDQIREGDYLYLLYQGMVYRYQYVADKIVPPTDWSVIAPQGFSCLTLTTCDPIGAAQNRLIVTAELVDWQEFDHAYRFIPGEQPAA